MMSNLQKELNQLVASWSVLYVKLHNFHWYVKGTSFFTLHEKFEELYNEAAVNLDEIAERILALGGQPVATLKEYLEISEIKEAVGSETAEQMVKTLIQDFETMMKNLKNGMSEAANENDDTTEDLLNSINQSLEKHVWMLKAFIS
ncbi:Dps family protein [Rummeliibacillus pycnus]|uniref:Dps family protein n=1 Tax=Rummeliibacillus pycnus TaxID=101070 RepID=UPI003D274C51